LEFAILAIPFFTWLLFIFELSYDLFVQEALDYAVHGAVRQIQTGNATSTNNVTNAAQFFSTYLCNATRGLLECPHIWLRVAAVQTGSGGTGVPDFAPPTTTGGPPVHGGTLDLSQYTNSADAHTGGGQNVRQPYCTASPSQAILVSAVYLGPSFVGSLLPGVMSVTYNRTFVHPTFSSAGFVTEAFPATTQQSSASAGGGGTGSFTAPSCSNNG
jgi:hypothetical protein